MIRAVDKFTKKINNVKKEHMMIKRRKKLGYMITNVLLIALLACSCGAKKDETDGGKGTQTGTSVTAEPTKGVEGNEQPEPTDTPAPTEEPFTWEKDKASLPKPGDHSIQNLLMTALQPVGKTMYIWGGGWNEADNGAGEEAVKFGVSKTWEEFAAKQNSAYDYNTTRYQIHNGLDCSGYMGWLVYNVIENEEGKAGYVMKSTEMAPKLAEKGFGTYAAVGTVSTWKAGDVASMQGHVWLSLGTCEDGSVLLVHASPPGVKISGTLLANGSRSKAVELAENIMKNNYADWYNRYPDCTVPYSYLTKSGVFSWGVDTLSDEWKFREMSAEEVAKQLFN